MKKYKLIYLDPPWWYDNKFYQGGNKSDDIQTHYKTMNREELIKLPIKNLSDENCILFLWTTDSHLQFALDLIKYWGFEYKTVAFIWIKKTINGKDCINYSPWTLKSAEICLMGKRGKIRRKSTRVRQLLYAARRKHSQKPDEIRERIVDLMGNIPRVELFATSKTPGWDVWGNKINNDINLEKYYNES